MDELQIFNNEEFGDVRVVMINEDPWLVGKEIAEILGYKNTRDALAAHVDEEDKVVIQKSEIATLEIPNRGLTMINESGLYSLILSSKLPSAKRFKRWVTSEVLPSIRKRGIYGTEETIDRMIADPEWGIRLLTEYKEEKQRNKELTEQIAVQNQQIQEMSPKATYYDVVLQSPNLVTTSEISKDYGMSAKEFNKMLHKFGVQYKMSNKIWLLYSKYQDKGYTKTKTSIDKNGQSHTWTNWTQPGRLFLYELLKSKGILPAIETI